MEPHPITDTKEGDPLQTKYYCQIDNSQHMNVVMELKAEKRETLERLPLRYVLVIDVSGSMENRVGVQQRTLLQRVQLFAELAVRKMNENDWLSIVTFSGDCVVELPMTRMNSASKQMSRNILKRLQTRSNTNLECGLIGALEVIKSSQKMFRASRDCIILFTDGEANEGELDAKKLIQKFKHVQSNINKQSCVPVSAFTIGEYHPDLLIEISKHLGSESFYWLNDEEDFEADMLIPLFLRETTSISDVAIKFESLDNSYFDPVDHNAAHFMEWQINKVKLKKNKKTKKVKEPTKLFFFIYALPDDNSKNISFDVALPQMAPEELDGRRVVDITIHYLDAELNPRTIQDYILISIKSLVDSRSMDPVASKNIVAISASLMEVSAFIMTGHHAMTSWKEAQEVIVKVAEQKCKLASVTSIANAKKNVGETQSRRFFQEANEEINMIRKRTETLLPDGGESVAKMTRLCEEWTSRLNHANDITATNDSRNYSKLASMESSINTEMPTSGGVFRGKQPYMSAIMEQKLIEERKNLEAARRLQSGSEIDVGTAKQRVRRAIETGNLPVMEQCFQDLSALELFGMGVEDSFLDYIQKEIDHRRQLEDLKRRLAGSLTNEEFSLVANLLTEMKELRAKTDLTFTEGDKNAFQKASNALSLYQRKRGLRGEIASNMPHLNLPLIPRNMEKVSNAIETLVRLRNQSKDFDDVFTDRDNTLLNMAIANVGDACKQMDSISRAVNELVPVLSLPKHPSNYEAITDTIKKMEDVKKEAERYEGLFTQREEVILKAACDNRDSLADEKGELLKKIQDLIPTLELPMLPRNYQMLSSAVNEMTPMRQRAILFKDFFLPEYENILNQASRNVAMLLTKKEDFAEKIDRNIFDARLPKLPANFERIKAAVISITEAREESKGFKNVFNEEHAKILQSAEASAKILETEKTEVQKDEAECVVQIQLPMLPVNYNQICQGIDTMKRITPELKGFGLYKESYDGFLKTANFNRDVLNDKKKQILKELQDLKPKVAMTPDNLNSLRNAVERMTTLKESSQGFDNLFTSTNESDLFEASTKLEHLTASVEKMHEARHMLEEAVNKRKYTRLKHAVKKASRAPFIDRDELREPRKLLSFLDPKKRCAALKNAIEDEDIEEIEEALLEMKEAAVVNDGLEEKANRTLRKLRKQKRREERERRRIEKERRRRQREMERLERTLNGAIESRDIETLEQAVQEFDDGEFVESEVPVATEAKELLRYLKVENMRKKLQDGLRTRDVESLYNALMDAKYGNYEEHMQKEYAEAEGLLVYLLEMMRLREEIMKMTRASISEVHAYPHPPKSVINIMKAIYTILGEPYKEIKEWAKIQALLGRLDRSSITKRVKRFKIKDLTSETAEKAQRFLRNLELEEVETVSRVAATFFAWAKYIVKEVEHFEKELEKKSRQIEEAEKEDSEKYDQEEFEAAEENSVSSTEQISAQPTSNGDVKDSYSSDGEIPEEEANANQTKNK